MGLPEQENSGKHSLFIRKPIVFLCTHSACFPKTLVCGLNEKEKKLSHDLAYTYMLGIYGKEHGIAKRHVYCGTTTKKWEPCRSTAKWTQTALYTCVIGTPFSQKKENRIFSFTK